MFVSRKQSLLIDFFSIPFVLRTEAAGRVVHEFLEAALRFLKKLFLPQRFRKMIANHRVHCRAMPLRVIARSGKEIVVNCQRDILHCHLPCTHHNMCDHTGFVTPRTAATTFCAASSRSSAAITSSPESRRIALPCSTFVP